MIPIGSYCLPAQALRAIGWRTEAFPFDWVSRYPDTLVSSNLVYNLAHIYMLMDGMSAEEVASKYIGDAFENKIKLDQIFGDQRKNNIENNLRNSQGIWFPHEHGSKEECLEKYSRRFARLKERILSGNQIFVYGTRRGPVPQKVIDEFLEKVVNKYSSILVIISASGMTYSGVTDIHLDYDESKFWKYDKTYQKGMELALNGVLEEYIRQYLFSKFREIPELKESYGEDGEDGEVRKS